MKSCDQLLEVFSRVQTVKFAALDERGDDHGSLRALFRVCSVSSLATSSPQTTGIRCPGVRGDRGPRSSRARFIVP